MTRTALEVRQNPGGLFTIEDQSLTTGARFYVHHTGTDGVGHGTGPDDPVASLDYAIGLCTASQGDVIYVMPGHAETTTAIALDVIGVKIVGLGWGRTRPTLTASTAASNLLDVTVASCVLQNLRFVGAASGNTALLASSSAGTDLDIIGCSFEHGAAPLLACSMAGSRFRFLNCTWLGTANGPDAAIDLANHCKDWVVSGCRFLYGGYGLDLAVIESLNDAQEGYLIEDIIVVGLDTLLVNIVSSTAAPPDGLMTRVRVMMSAPVNSVGACIAAATSKGMAFADCLGIDETGKAAAKIPKTSVVQ